MGQDVRRDCRENRTVRFHGLDDECRCESSDQSLRHQTVHPGDEPLPCKRMEVGRQPRGRSRLPSFGRSPDLGGGNTRDRCLLVGSEAPEDRRGCADRKSSPECASCQVRRACRPRIPRDRNQQRCIRSPDRIACHFNAIEGLPRCECSDESSGS